MRRVLAAVCLASCLLPLSVSGQTLPQKSAKVFRDAKAELAAMESEGKSAAAAAEIARARKWIEEGLERLRASDPTKAAVLAERLPPQLRLVRALLDAAREEADADKAELAAHAFSESVRLLQARYDRLVLEARGTALTGAVPHAEDAGAK
ncbi:MAG: hypothetical protein PHU25_14370 [Deltaproteobacteria bacterium]|nr:hypothetical protein [Deltaproteobacteria bacterium]